MKKLCLAAAVLFSVVSVQAVLVTLTNADFNIGGNAFPQGFDIPGNDVVGWQNLYPVDGRLRDAGVEGSAAWWGTYEGNSAFMQTANPTGTPAYPEGDGAFNLTDFEIQEGNVFDIGFAAKSWDGASQWTVSLFYDDPANVFGSFTQAVTGAWVLYSGRIEATPASVGGILGISFQNTAASGMANLDEVSINLAPFAITVSPTGDLSDPAAVVEAVIDNINNSVFVSATLSLDGAIVDSDNSGVGTTRTLSYTDPLSLGVHTGQVVAVSSTEAMTNTWTFTMEPFHSITTSPRGWLTTNGTELVAVIDEGFSTVDSAEMYLDDVLLTSTLDRTMAPTTTVTAAVSGIADGLHSARIILSGSPEGLVTNDWTFGTYTDVAKPTAVIHHWDFNDGTGTNVADLVGDADGSIIGANYSWIVDGGINLNGGGNSDGWNSGTNATGGAYIDLPNGMISAISDPAVTIEVVFERNAITSWARVWDFGNSTNGEDQSANGAGYWMLAASQSLNGNARTELQDGSATVVDPIPTDPNPYENSVLMHIVVVYDSTDARSGFFVNGVLVDAQISTFTPFLLSALPDVNNWIGRSQWGGDAMFNGKIYDMSIYTGVMNPGEVAARYREFASGGAPTVPPVLQYVQVNGDEVTLSWTAEDTGTYSLLRKTDLSAGSWTPVLEGLPSGNLTTNVTASGEVQEYYKVLGE